MRTELPPSRTTHRWPLLALPACFAGPALAEVGNAVVIDFDQGRLVLGWLGLWLIAALTFVLCAGKRIQSMTRLSDYLHQRARRRADDRSDAAAAAAAPQPASAERATRSRGFRAAPMPGMPRHLQYLPG